MDEKIINNHNGIVRPDDDVYFLGDFQFGGDYAHYYPRMNGKFIFIQGNHDRINPFRSRQGYLLKEINGYKVLMCHWPKYVREFNELKKEADILICGHIHEKGRFVLWNESDILINVSVDVWDFSPINFDEITKIYPKKENRESWVLEIETTYPHTILRVSPPIQKTKSSYKKC